MASSPSWPPAPSSPAMRRGTRSTSPRVSRRRRWPRRASSRELDVQVTVTGTLCPQDLRRAAMPGFLVRWELTNTGAEARTVRCEMGWPNLVGIGGGIASMRAVSATAMAIIGTGTIRPGAAESRVAGDGYLALRYTGTPCRRSTWPPAGEHLLGMATTPGITADVSCGATVPASPLPSSACLPVAVPPPPWRWSWPCRTGLIPRSVDRGHDWQCDFADGACAARGAALRKPRNCSPKPAHWPRCSTTARCPPGSPQRLIQLHLSAGHQ